MRRLQWKPQQIFLLRNKKNKESNAPFIKDYGLTGMFISDVLIQRIFLQNSIKIYSLTDSE